MVEVLKLIAFLSPLWLSAFAALRWGYETYQRKRKRDVRVFMV
jgi:hypothetical protein